MKCSVCAGACCEELLICSSTTGADFPEADREFMDVRGTLVEPGVYAVSSRCPRLSRRGRCKMYDDRPLACALLVPGGKECLAVVRRRRIPEEYRDIREDHDPEVIHGDSC
jgi:Fe-S-cluster containining protein